AQNSRVRAGPDRSAFPLAPACLPRVKWSCVRSFLWHRTRLGIPDLGGVLGNRAVAGELPGTGDVQDSLACPRVAVGAQLGQSAVCLEIGFEVRQVHVMVPMGQQGVP